MAFRDRISDIIPKLQTLQHSSDSESRKEYILFVGNYGVGKSAICNSLGASCESSVGVSAVTVECTQHVVGLEGKKVILLDTPGIYEASESNVRRNIDEITKALKHDGNYRLVFVTTLRGGRFPYEDAAIMKSITTALKRKRGPIGVIVNRLEPREFANLDDPKEAEELLLQFQVACGVSDKGSVASAIKESGAPVEIFRIPRNRVGDDWAGPKPYEELAKWLLQLPSDDVKIVHKIRSPLEVEAETEEAFKKLQSESQQREEDRKRQEQESAEAVRRAQEEADRKVQELQEEVDKWRTSKSRAGTATPVKTKVTNRDELHSEWDSESTGQTKLIAYFETSFTEIFVNTQDFDNCKSRLWQILAGFGAVATVGLSLGIQWLRVSRGMHINDKAACNVQCQPVVKIEQVVEGETLYDVEESKYDFNTWDNTEGTEPMDVKTSESSSIENLISHTLSSEMSIEKVTSTLSRFSLKLPFVAPIEGGLGCEHIVTQKTRKSFEANELSSTKVAGGEATEMKFRVPPHTKLIVEKWVKRETWTTHFTNTTSYEGQVLWAGLAGDEIRMPAGSIWPPTAKDWQVSQTQIKRFSKATNVSRSQIEQQMRGIIDY